MRELSFLSCRPFQMKQAQEGRWRQQRLFNSYKFTWTLSILEPPSTIWLSSSPSLRDFSPIQTRVLLLAVKAKQCRGDTSTLGCPMAMQIQQPDLREHRDGLLGVAQGAAHHGTKIDVHGHS